MRAAPGLTLGVLALPVLGGLAGTLGPAFSPGAVAGLLDWPGLWRATILSLGTGLASTALSLAMTVLVLSALRETRAFRTLMRVLSPLLSVPHAAAALGLAFLIAPSGWIARALSPWATGWQVPPDVVVLNDPWGMALVLGLIVKEVPFLLLMALAALPQADAARRLTLAATLGYGAVAGFLLVVLPALYRQLRLPVFAVLAYAMTTVDMGQILGPTLRPTLSVQILRWMTDPGLGQRDTAAAGAALQLALVLAALGLWRAAEGVAAALGRRWVWQGARAASIDALARGVAVALAAGLAGLLVAGLAGLAVWSVAGLWPFPDALPQGVTLQVWMQAGQGLAQTTATTAVLALGVAGVAVGLTLASLEAGQRFGLRPGRMTATVLWLPLLVPQIAFLPGLQALALGLGLGPWAATGLAHLTFALPYAVLSLSPAWAAMDPRIAPLAATLGAGPARMFWTLRLPMLLRPLLTAAAVAMAVSVGQYLPTLLMSGGRIATLTTDAVALSSGGNRRLIGAHALLQMALPAAAFACAIGLPALAFANRKAMQP